MLVAGTALGVGPFVVRSEGMLSLWMSLVVAGSAIVTAGGLLAERDHALHQQRRLLGELDHALHQQRRLLAELDHRVKNALATVVALAERSGDGAVDLDDFRARFIGRVRAIAQTHEGLARSNWGPMKVTDVVAMTLAPFVGASSDHLLASGDQATLPMHQVAPLTMVLHELATNAAKYGAWSRNGGRVAVAWAYSADGALRLSWRETGGPELSARPAPGYGLRLIEGIVNHELGGVAELDFSKDGLVCTLHIPGAENGGHSR
jgi:two-component sensor histidine kinase